MVLRGSVPLLVYYVFIKRKMQFHAVVFLKFVYSEKATKFCEISTLLLSVSTVDKSKVEISQNFEAFSENKNFKGILYGILTVLKNSSHRGL